MEGCTVIEEQSTNHEMSSVLEDSVMINTYPMVKYVKKASQQGSRSLVYTGQKEEVRE